MARWWKKQITRATEDGAQGQRQPCVCGVTRRPNEEGAKEQESKDKAKAYPVFEAFFKDKIVDLAIGNVTGKIKGVFIDIDGKTISSEVAERLISSGSLAIPGLEEYANHKDKLGKLFHDWIFDVRCLFCNLK